ncbi:MAG: mechanosensitive ion channel domain-containing protein [Methanobacteriota archaeon]
MAATADYGIMIFFSTIIVLALIYIFMHMDNLLYYFKLKKDRRIEDDTLDFTFGAIKVLWASLAAMFLVELATFLKLDYADDVAQAIYDYVFAIFVFCLVIVVVWFVARLGSRHIEQSMQKAVVDPNAYIKPGLLEFYELFVKYFIYAIGFVFATFTAMVAIPDETQRQRVFDWMGFARLNVDELAASLSAYVILLIVFFLVWKLASLMLDDFKKKSTKFPPRVIDLVKAFVRYGLTWLAMVVTLTIILDLFNFQYVEMVIYVIIAATFILLLVVAFSPTTREGFSGVVLLISDSVNKDDWISIDGVAEGRVVSQNLLTTRLAAENGEIMDVPNSKITSSVVRNWTKTGRVEVSLSLPSGVPGATAMRSAASIDGVSNDPMPEVVSRILENGTTAKTLRFYVTDFQRRRAISELLTAEFLLQDSGKA